MSFSVLLRLQRNTLSVVLLAVLAAPLIGRYSGPSRGREMTVEITRPAQGLAMSVNGAPARPLPWVDGWTFRQGSTFLTFKRAGTSGPATELRNDGGGGLYILKRQ